MPMFSKSRGTMSKPNVTYAVKKLTLQGTWLVGAVDWHIDSIKRDDRMEL